MGQAKKQQTALSHPLGQPEPFASMFGFFFFFVLITLGKDAFVFSSPVVVSLGAPSLQLLCL